MATTLEALVEVRDRATRPLERIKRAADGVERNLHGATRATTELDAALYKLNRHTAKPKIELQDRAARARLTWFKASLGAMTSRPHVVRVRVEKSGRGGGIGDIFGGGPGRGGIWDAFQTTKIAGMVALIGNLIPLVAELATGIGAVAAAAATLVPMTAALAAGFGGMALVAIPFFKKLQNAEEGLTATQDKILTQAKLLKQAWEQATAPATRSLERMTLKALKLGNALMPAFAGLTNRMGAAQEQLVGQASNYLQSPAQMKLMAQAMRPLPGLFTQLIQLGGHLFKIFQGITIAAAPLASWILDKLDKALGALGDRLSTQKGIKEFRDTLNSYRPMLAAIGRALSALWDGFWRLAKAGQPFFVQTVDALIKIGGALSDVAIAFTTNLMNAGFIEWWSNFSDVLREVGMQAAALLGQIWALTGTILKGFNALPGPVKSATAALIAFLAIMKFFGPAGALVLTGLKQLAIVIGFTLVGSLFKGMKAIETFKIAMSGMTTAGWVGLAITALALLALGITTLLNRKSQMEKWTESFQAGLQNISDAAATTRDALSGILDIVNQLNDAQLNIDEAKLRKTQAEREFQTAKKAWEAAGKPKAGAAWETYESARIARERAGGALKGARERAADIRQHGPQDALKKQQDAQLALSKARTDLFRWQKELQTLLIQPIRSKEIKAHMAQLRQQIATGRAKLPGMEQEVWDATKAYTEATNAAKRRATGGVVAGPQLSMLGERGPEAVIPLSAAYRYQSEAAQRAAARRAGGAGGGAGGARGQSPLLHIENVYIRDKSDLDTFANRVTDAITRALQNVPKKVTGAAPFQPGAGLW